MNQNIKIHFISFSSQSRDKDSSSKLSGLAMVRHRRSLPLRDPATASRVRVWRGRRCMVHQRAPFTRFFLHMVLVARVNVHVRAPPPLLAELRGEQLAQALQTRKVPVIEP